MAALPELLPHEEQRVLERIIVPLDGSARAERVLGLVVPLAQRLGSELTLLHVLLPRHETPARAGEISYPDALHDRARALATDYLSEVSRNIVQGQIRTKTVVAAGRVSDMILAHADHGSFSMIAVGAKPRPRIWRFFREGVTESVWAASRVPLLFSASDGDDAEAISEPGLPDNVLVPVNGSPRSEVALEYARQIASGAGMSVTVVGTRPTKLVLPVDGRTKIEYGKDPDGYLEERVEPLRNAGIPVEIVRRGERTAEALRQLDSELPPHLVIMSAGRRRSFNRTIFGYTIARIVRHTSNPIVFLPPGYEPPGDQPD